MILPSDQFEGYFEEVLGAVCRATNNSSIKDFGYVVDLAKVASINILSDTIARVFYSPADKISDNIDKLRWIAENLYMQRP